MFDMRRRQFITPLGGVAAVAARGARAAAHMRRIGLQLKSGLILI